MTGVHEMIPLRRKRDLLIWFLPDERAACMLQLVGAIVLGVCLAGVAVWIRGIA